jgi:hypothetical protein
MNVDPIAVPDLDEAVRLLQLPVEEIELAAELVRPYLHADGCTRFWSLHQLAHQVERDRLHVRRPAPPLRRRPPMITRDQAVAAHELARKVGATNAAAQLGHRATSMHRAWRRYGLPSLTDREVRRGRHARVPLDQIEDLVEYLAGHGPDKTAAHFGIARSTVYGTLRRHRIAPPLGQGRRPAAA